MNSWCQKLLDATCAVKLKIDSIDSDLFNPLNNHERLFYVLITASGKPHPGSPNLSSWALPFPLCFLPGSKPPQRRLSAIGPAAAEDTLQDRGRSAGGSAFGDLGKSSKAAVFVGFAPTCKQWQVEVIIQCALCAF